MQLNIYRNIIHIYLIVFQIILLSFAWVTLSYLFRVLLFNEKIRQKAQSDAYLINEIYPHQCIIIDM